MFVYCLYTESHFRLLHYEINSRNTCVFNGYEIVPQNKNDV